MPVQSAIFTGFGPLETVSATTVSAFTRAPGSLDAAVTVPTGTVALQASVTSPGLSRAFVSAATAAARDSPTRVGTG